MKPEKFAVTYMMEPLEETDHRVVCYARRHGDRMVMIIPKTIGKMFETDGTYVVEIDPEKFTPIY